MPHWLELETIYYFDQDELPRKSASAGIIPLMYVNVIIVSRTYSIVIVLMLYIRIMKGNVLETKISSSKSRWMIEFSL